MMWDIQLSAPLGNRNERMREILFLPAANTHLILHYQEFVRIMIIALVWVRSHCRPIFQLFCISINVPPLDKQ